MEFYGVSYETWSLFEFQLCKRNRYSTYPKLVVKINSHTFQNRMARFISSFPCFFSCLCFLHYCQLLEHCFARLGCFNPIHCQGFCWSIPWGLQNSITWPIFTKFQILTLPALVGSLVLFMILIIFRNNSGWKYVALSGGKYDIYSF